MKRFFIRAATLFALVGFILTGESYAVPVTYTSQAAFQIAIAGLADQQTLTFDSLAAGTLLPSGTAAGQINFTYSISGLTLQVRNDFGTTSPSNYLGLNTFDGIFVSGDSFTMTFNQPINALGLYVISGDLIFDGDFSLLTNIGSSAVNSGTPDVVLSDGNAYFIGLVDTQSFTQADLISFDPTLTGLFTFNVDDITSASSASVPEPGTLLLVGSGLAGLALWRWKAKRDG